MTASSVKATKGGLAARLIKKLTARASKSPQPRSAVSGWAGRRALNADKARHFLAAPRNEMLKEVLVQGCMGRFAKQEEREQWSQWFKRLFGSAPEVPEIRGTVIDVALGSAAVVAAQDIAVGEKTIRLEHLCETDVQRLLEPPSSPESCFTPLRFFAGATNWQSTTPVDKCVARITRVNHSNSTQATSRGRTSKRNEETAYDADPNAARQRPTTAPSALVQARPPVENVFGLIVQTAAATKLYNKAVLAREQERRFTGHTLHWPCWK